MADGALDVARDEGIGDLLRACSHSVRLINHLRKDAGWCRSGARPRRA
jgi:hypothetical protein